MSNESERPKVLIVEDEMMLRMRATDIVEDAGFMPVEAINADEAISILETRSDITVLFTDIQMPGSIDGLKLAHAVHKRWPAIKIMLVSGRVNPSDSEKPAESRFFAKPLSAERMIIELQAMVGESTHEAGANETLGMADETVSGTLSAHPSPLSVREAVLTAENDSLRQLLEQASFDAGNLLEQAGIEANERDAAQKLQKIILGELHHRIKNTLTIVSAIASQSFRTAPNVEHGQKAMEGRLMALGRTHDLLMQENWSTASLINTFGGAIEPFDSKAIRRFKFDGPDIKITSGAVIAFAMTFNELCTNTTKFGALSTPLGRVEIAWTIDDEKQRLRLSWIERGGPLVYPPSRRSFGTRMIESLGKQLNGSVELIYEASGFVYLLDVPLSSIVPAD